MNKPLPDWVREVLLRVGFTREELEMPTDERSRAEVVRLSAYRRPPAAVRNQLNARRAT
jgi:hypothetical protein